MLTVHLVSIARVLNACVGSKELIPSKISIGPALVVLVNAHFRANNKQYFDLNTYLPVGAFVRLFDYFYLV